MNPASPPEEPLRNATPTGRALVLRSPRRQPARRRLWPALLLVLLAGGLALYTGFDRLGGVPFSLQIDGEQVVQGVDLASVSPGHRLAVVAGVLLALLLLAVLLPLTLLLLALAVVGVLLLVLGAPLLAVALAVTLVLALVASPLVLMGLLLWWLLRALRRPARATATGSATIPA